MVEPGIKLAIRRRVQNKNKAKEDEISFDDNFEQHLEVIIEEEVENNVNNLDEIVNNNVENNNSEPLTDKPKRGRPPKVSGALAESPKSPQVLRRSNRNKK